MDLSHAMHDAARGVTAPRPPIAPGPVLQRIRRRRAARYAVQGTVAVAAAGAVALGGAHLAGRPLPGPASTPTPTSTETAITWPTAVTLAGAAPLCGEPMPGTVQPDGLPELRLDATLPEGPATAGELINVEVQLFGPDGFELLALSPSLVVLRDGVVVATEPNRTDDAGIWYSTSVSPLNWPPQVLDLVECETAGRGAVALDAGVYELYAVQTLFGSDAVGNPDEERTLTVVGGPWTLDVVPAAEPNAESDTTRLPGCGESTASLTASSVPLTGSATVKVGLLSDVTSGAFLHEGYGDALWIDTAVLNRGPDLYQAWGFVTELVVAEDGRVVMTWGDEGGDPAPADWPSGTTRLGLGGPVQTAHCTAGTPGILGPGEYTLWVRSVTQAAAEPGGEALPLSLILAPVTFRVYDFEDPDNQGPVTWTSAGPAS